MPSSATPQLQGSGGCVSGARARLEFLIEFLDRFSSLKQVELSDRLNCMSSQEVRILLNVTGSLQLISSK